jgi:hypothetical protein
VAHNRLPDSLLVLGVLTLESIGHQVLVDEDLRVESVLVFELLDLDIVTFWLDPGRRNLVACVNGLDMLVFVASVNGIEIGKKNDRWWKLETQQGRRALMSFRPHCSDCTYECQLPIATVATISQAHTCRQPNASRDNVEVTESSESASSFAIPIASSRISPCLGLWRRLEDQIGGGIRQVKYDQHRSPSQYTTRSAFGERGGGKMRRLAV